MTYSKSPLGFRSSCQVLQQGGYLRQVLHRDVGRVRQQRRRRRRRRREGRHGGEILKAMKERDSDNVRSRGEQTGKTLIIS